MTMLCNFCFISEFFKYAPWSKRFMLNEMFQWNASKFAVYFWNAKTHEIFFISCMLYFIFSEGVFLISGNESSSICRLRFSSRIVSKILTLWWSESWLVDASCVSKSHFASDFSINMLTHSGLKMEKNTMKTIFCVSIILYILSPLVQLHFRGKISHWLN